MMFFRVIGFNALLMLNRFHPEHAKIEGAKKAVDHLKPFFFGPDECEDETGDMC